MVNVGLNTVCTTYAQCMHNAYIQFGVNLNKRNVNGSQALTNHVNPSLTSGQYHD